MRLQDHPWQKSASCNKLLQSGAVADLTHLPGWFALQVSQLAKSHGLKGIQAWQDGLKEISDNRQFSTRDNLVNFWDTLYWGASVQSMTGRIKVIG